MHPSAAIALPAPVAAAGAEPESQVAASLASLSALCMVARLHHVAADPLTLRHQLGLTDLNAHQGLGAERLQQRHLGRHGQVV